MICMNDVDEYWMIAVKFGVYNWLLMGYNSNFSLPLYFKAQCISLKTASDFTVGWCNIWNYIDRLCSVLIQNSST